MPTNITRGNIEGLIAMKVNIVPLIVTARYTVQQVFLLPGVLESDVVVNISMPSYVSGISIATARIPVSRVLRITFANTNLVDTMPPTGMYTLILGRLSDSTTLDNAQFS